MANEQSACRAIVKCKDNANEKPVTEHADWKSTIKCNCRLCAVISTVLWAEEKWAQILADRYSFPITHIQSRIILGPSYSRREIFVSQPHKLDQLPQLPSLPGSTASDHSFETAMRWMKHCLRTHKKPCGGLPALNLLPSRVLKVTPFCVRLVQISQEQGHYVSLSHCWGPREHQPLRTTLNPDTFSRHKVGINVKDMPKTFRDAVEFTRRLGVQYLWIDSLCIIQDSIRDWQTESAQMADIYRNAIVTLAASAAPDGRHGLYVSTDKEFIDRPLSSLTGRDEDQSIRFRTPLSHNWTDHPLFHRAWTFQERLLSPRVLHFGRHELVWECIEERTCECSALSNKALRPHTHWLEPKGDLHPENLSKLPYEEVMEIWHRAVACYSRMGLSVEADILPAISGIAKILKEAINGEYMAGLWKKNLGWDLCWRTTHPAEARRPERWRAPSFSWASVVAGGGGVNYWGLNLSEDNPWSRSWVEHIKVIDAKCSLAGVDKTGAITDGFLLISCSILIRATVACDQHTRRWIIPNVGLGQPSIRIFPDYEYDVDGPQGVRNGQVVYILKVLSIQGALPTQERRGRRDYSRVMYLVLRKPGMEKDHSGVVSNKEGDIGVYERIALCQDSGDPNDYLEAVSSRDMVFEDVIIKII